LKHPQVNVKRSLVKELLWIMSNLAAGTAAQVKAVMSCGIVEVALKVLVRELEEKMGEDIIKEVPLFGTSTLPFGIHPGTKKEARFVVSNLFESAESVVQVIEEHPDWINAIVFYLVHSLSPGQQMLTVVEQISLHGRGKVLLREALARVLHAPGATSTDDAVGLCQQIQDAAAAAAMRTAFA